jgi:hypothetical protein
LISAIGRIGLLTETRIGLLNFLKKIRTVYTAPLLPKSGFHAFLPLLLPLLRLILLPYAVTIITKWRLILFLKPYLASLDLVD